MSVQKNLLFNPLTGNFDYSISTTEINNLLSAIKIITLYEVLSFTNTNTGTVTPPSGATIFTEHYGAGERVILSEVSSGLPTYTTPTNGSTVITGTINQSGQVLLSQNYIGDIAVLYGIRISNEDYSKLDVSATDRVIDTLEEPDAVFRNPYLGWIQFNDTQYTSSSPLTVDSGVRTQLTNNKGFVLNTVNAIGANNWWNSTTNLFQPDFVGDTFRFRVGFIVDPSLNNRNLTIDLDIGGTQGIIWSKTIRLVRGAGVDTIVTENIDIYTLNTFVTNGGTINLTCDGDIDIFDIIFKIEKVFTPITPIPSTDNGLTSVITSLNNKLETGGYVGTAQNLKDDIDNISITPDILNLTIEFAAFTNRFYTTRKPYSVANSFYLTSADNLPDYSISPDYIGYGILEDVVLNNVELLSATHFNETYTYYLIVKRVVANVETTIIAWQSNPEIYSANVFKRSSYSGIGFQLLEGDRVFLTTLRNASSEGNVATALDVNIRAF